MNPFFVLPGSALLGLREELEIMEGDYAGETLERMGFRAGISLVKSLEVGSLAVNSFAEVFTQLWAESGLSRAHVEKVEVEEIIVDFDDSLEASHGRRCDFTRGYLSGIVSGLLGVRYEAEEKVCMSEGAKRCVHHLTPSMHQFPIRKKESASQEWKPILESGCSYLIESEDPSAAFDLFNEYLVHEVPGMCIVREYPEKLKKRFELNRAYMLWLSFERDITYAREPTNIALIYSEIKSFLDGSGGIVLLSGLEYLISQNSFNKILKFIQLLNEAVAVNDSILLIPISTGAMNNREVKQLERELRILGTATTRPADMEMLKLED